MIKSPSIFVKMTMIGSLVRFGRRQLHTIVSRDIIKPSSPTPSHLKTHNLSVLDQIGANTFMPKVVFYASNGDRRSSQEKTLDLKNSLSQTLTKYYPFAGRLAKTAPAYVDCNDEGAEFLEASVDTKLVDFLRNSQHEDFDRFFPYGLVNYESNRGDHDLQSDKVVPLAVQVNHFECGGVAVAVSLSHKIADGSSLAHFLNDWATMTRFCSKEQKEDEFPINPLFIPFQDMNMNFKGFSLEASSDCVTRSFMFSNSKISDLKHKVTDMGAESGQPITNPTRVEALCWLLYKCAMAASIENNPGFKSIGVGQLTNIRGKMIEPLPANTIGNFFMTMEILRNDQSEIKPEWFIGEIKKQKMQFQGLRNIESVLQFLSSMATETALEEQQRKIDDAFICTSLCRHPAYEIDFGWGKPVKATIAGNLRNNSVILMDSPNGDGIEALVCLEKQDMAVFQTNPELLAFC